MGISLTEQGINYDNRQMIYNNKYKLNTIIKIINMFRIHKKQLHKQFIEVGYYKVGLDYDQVQIMKYISYLENKKMESINNGG